MTRPDRRWLLTSVRRALTQHGWTDAGNAVRELVDGIDRNWQDNGGGPSASALVALMPTRLSAVNGIDPNEIALAIAVAVHDAPADTSRAIVSMDEIDSFAAARQLSPMLVAPFADPLPLPERTVKVFIASIIGEGYIPKDWGGEANDLFSARVVFGGRRVNAAFLLNGSGTRGRLTIRRLGANGDQMVRLAGSPADLLIVQHVGEVDEAVRANLNDLVRARRSERSSLTGSVWDGIDTARLFMAHGLIDAEGNLSAAGRIVLDQDEAKVRLR